MDLPAFCLMSDRRSGWLVSWIAVPLARFGMNAQGFWNNSALGLANVLEARVGAWPGKGGAEPISQQVQAIKPRQVEMG